MHLCRSVCPSLCHLNDTHGPLQPSRCHSNDRNTRAHFAPPSIATRSDRTHELILSRVPCKKQAKKTTEDQHVGSVRPIRFGWPDFDHHRSWRSVDQIASLQHEARRSNKLGGAQVLAPPTRQPNSFGSSREVFDDDSP